MSLNVLPIVLVKIKFEFKTYVPCEDKLKIVIQEEALDLFKIFWFYLRYSSKLLYIATDIMIFVGL